jgi:hypothetical protein
LNAPCVGIITETNPDIVDYIPELLFRFHIQIGGKDSSILNLEESDTLDYASLNNETLNFETLLIDSLNAGCPIYVIQVSNPKAVIHCFARASRRALFRANRKYLYLPALQDGFTFSDNTGMNPKDIFTMKEMDYMPDLVVARIMQNEYIGNEIKDDCRFTICNDIDPKTMRFGSNCTGSNPSKFLGALSSEIKIELLTHKFIGSESSKNVLLDIWISDIGNCSGKFLRSVGLFPDKTRDMMGKELTLVTWYYPPFIILDFNASPPLYDGIEFRVVLEFLQYINATFRQVCSS